MASNRIEEQDIPESNYTDPVEDEEEDLDSSMTLIEHLEELRWRIFKSIIAIALGSLIAFIFRVPILTLLELPLPKMAADALTHGKPVVTGITEGFTVFLMISVAVGFILALRVVLYQIWAFISPGLLAKEKKYAIPFIFAGLILFAAGVTVGFFVLQYPVEWLISFASDSFAALITAGSYFTFVAFFLLAFGIVFELPLVLTFLARVDLISSQTLIMILAPSHIGVWIATTRIRPGA